MFTRRGTCLSKHEEEELEEEEEKRLLQLAGFDDEVVKEWGSQERRSTLTAIKASTLSAGPTPDHYRALSESDTVEYDDEREKKAERKFDASYLEDNAETQAPQDVVDSDAENSDVNHSAAASPAHNQNESDTSPRKSGRPTSSLSKGGQKQSDGSDESSEENKTLVAGEQSEEEGVEEETQAYDIEMSSSVQQGKTERNDEDSEDSVDPVGRIELEGKSYQRKEKASVSRRIAAEESKVISDDEGEGVKLPRKHRPQAFLYPPYFAPPEIKNPDLYIPVIKLMFDIYFRRFLRRQTMIGGKREKWGETVLAGNHVEGCMKMISKSRVSHVDTKLSLRGRPVRNAIRSFQTVAEGKKEQDKKDVYSLNSNSDSDVERPLNKGRMTSYTSAGKKAEKNLEKENNVRFTFSASDEEMGRKVDTENEQEEKASKALISKKSARPVRNEARKRTNRPLTVQRQFSDSDEAVVEDDDDEWCPETKKSYSDRRGRSQASRQGGNSGRRGKKLAETPVIEYLANKNRDKKFEWEWEEDLNKNNSISRKAKSQGRNNHSKNGNCRSEDVPPISPAKALSDDDSTNDKDAHLTQLSGTDGHELTSPDRSELSGKRKGVLLSQDRSNLSGKSKRSSLSQSSNSNQPVEVKALTSSQENSTDSEVYLLNMEGDMYSTQLAYSKRNNKGRKNEPVVKRRVAKNINGHLEAYTSKQNSNTASKKLDTHLLSHDKEEEQSSDSFNSDSSQKSVKFINEGVNKNKEMEESDKQEKVYVDDHIKVLGWISKTSRPSTNTYSKSSQSLAKRKGEDMLHDQNPTKRGKLNNPKPFITEESDVTSNERNPFRDMGLFSPRNTDDDADDDANVEMAQSGKHIEGGIDRSGRGRHVQTEPSTSGIQDDPVHHMDSHNKTPPKMGICPVCNTKFIQSELEMHAATCGDDPGYNNVVQAAPVAENEDCLVCKKPIPVDELKEHQSMCSTLVEDIPTRKTRSNKAQDLDDL